ncbi:hypothetical protein NDU88_005809 [Pleurodeles waltl]|uniref:Uncharacterized protein n=1 Tax=Pleurodeles waltl TaxID=8319 RepID=A0AAV7TCN8_PLEWA|nr:hypothetical protein NDU88_005809 [Pleurodeles waltl]
MYTQEGLKRLAGEWCYGGGPRHPKTELTLRAERSEGHDPILGLRPCRALRPFAASACCDPLQLPPAATLCSFRRGPRAGRSGFAGLRCSGLRRNKLALYQHMISSDVPEVIRGRPPAVSCEEQKISSGPVRTTTRSGAGRWHFHAPGMPLPSQLLVFPVWFG